MHFYELMSNPKQINVIILPYVLVLLQEPLASTAEGVGVIFK